MQSELYFDISSETSGGSLFKIKDGNGKDETRKIENFLVEIESAVNKSFVHHS